jgi:hypothetical protein
LLKGQAQLLAKLFLAEADEHAPHAHPVADMNID